MDTRIVFDTPLQYLLYRMLQALALVKESEGNLTCSTPPRFSHLLPRLDPEVGEVAVLAADPPTDLPRRYQNIEESEEKCYEWWRVVDRNNSR